MRAGFAENRKKRASHAVTTLEDGPAAAGTTRAFARNVAMERQLMAERVASNQMYVQGSVEGSEAMASLAERAKYIPMRLTEEERDLLRLLEGALKVSEYTDHVDVTSHDYGWGWSFSNTVRKKESKMEECARQVFEILLGLHLCFDFKEGQKRLKTEVIKHAAFFSRIFEVGRRYKIMNPDKMRTSYGKLMCILQDVSSPDVFDFQCDQPILTVQRFLEEHKCSDLLREDVDMVERVCQMHDLRVLSIEDQKQLSLQRGAEVEKLRAKYVASQRLTEDELMLVLNSLADGNAYVASCRHPVDRMINYLKKYFDAFDARTPEDSLAIQSGRNGSFLTHNHPTQYKFVMQSLQLWREIQNQMFRLWMAADHDLLNYKNPYRLYNTGQGLHRVQSAPHVSSCMREILSTVQSRVNGWVGLSVVHLGDRDVPNALVFIDKYTQVPRILAPTVLTLERVGVMAAEDANFARHLEEEYGGVEAVRKSILRDFLSAGFNGSGDDGGSCVGKEVGRVVVFDHVLILLFQMAD
jgi:hypothetical protein